MSKTLTELFAQVPYGQSIQAADITENLAFFDNWEDRYRYIIDLGKGLPEMPNALRTETHLVRGCQSQVWLVVEAPEAASMPLRFLADSDAFIVRGLIAILFAGLNCKTAAEITAHNTETWLDKLDLIRHLSQARGNGLYAMIEKIKQTAQTMHRQKCAG